ncbi:hypothetical protein [Pantoea sp. 18069]|uniref:hypothetical protein n=1 Tax=Pantoea sp. 18069 TaxID=2681415 RepID=UPI001F4773B0|nr:hypothetical protein [Pantoea sp. 18069]
MAIAVQQQDEIEVYVRADGAIVIMQALPDDGHECVTVWPVHAEALIRAIRSAKHATPGTREPA